MLLAVDVYYERNRAKVVAVQFENWTASSPEQVSSLFLDDDVAKYEPGAFYKRELPCILALLKTIDLSEVATIIVDGHVYLDNERNVGLGGRLYQALDATTAVVGVAKAAFRGNESQVVEVRRGQSSKPLFVSAIGIELDEAARAVTAMSGPFRIPTLLTILDRETKSW